ncbi:hypothetical protein [Bacillus suaedae]|uniref:Uncharacterized protein n=1 Tax=Halalkalibacter suaedae TaxID=2822140 RepID=A0A940WWY9_9BACI|nr:hypothetical protein [Bacillus suaedae]MBP3951948.1 hypothetical protein [Bacillus suaedae]
MTNQYIWPLIIFLLAMIILFGTIYKKRKPRLVLIKNHKTKSKINKLEQSQQQELTKMAVDQEHLLFLKALIEERISEKDYDEWANSRRHEGPDVFRKLLKRPYRLSRRL